MLVQVSRPNEQYVTLRDITCRDSRRFSFRVAEKIPNSKSDAHLKVDSGNQDFTADVKIDLEASWIQDKVP
eukprot:SAG11_NODE_6812_length_1242_cov_2.378828_1_plen_71_part_00